jgi:AcrR family transcriptional regulator
VPQVLKEEVRARMLEAALTVFAREGCAGATMAAIAAQAGAGAASLYRYYSSKEALFAAAIPPEVLQDLGLLLERRVRALARAAPGSPDRTGEEMFAFLRAHRLAMVVLLDRAQGTAHEGFGARFVESLVRLTAEGLREAHPGLAVRGPDRFVLRLIFDNARRALAAILAAHEDERALREALQAFWSYQVAGLRGFSARVAGAA